MLVGYVSDAAETVPDVRRNRHSIPALVTLERTEFRKSSEEMNSVQLFSRRVVYVLHSTKFQFRLVVFDVLLSLHIGKNNSVG